jgi:Zinc finger C-x8-C-x5-C-x3-H type (and similar)
VKAHNVAEHRKYVAAELGKTGGCDNHKFKTHLCHDYVRDGRCSRDNGLSCPFAHGFSDVR